MHLCPLSIGSRIKVRLKKLEGGSKSDFPRARSQVLANGSLDWAKTERPILANSTAKTTFRRSFITSPLSFRDAPRILELQNSGCVPETHLHTKFDASSVLPVPL